MRQAVVATVLVAFFGAHIPAPRTFTPIPVANGIRECGVDYDCLKRCHGDAACARQCRLPCRR